MRTFALNNGAAYTNGRTGNNFFVTDETRIHKRISRKEYEEAYEQFVKEENERQNAANQFTNIDPITEEDVQKAIEETEEDIMTGVIKEIQVEYCRHPEGTDLQVPATINEYGCVDCSKCNVQNCVHRNCMRRNPTSEGGLAECPRLKVKAEEPKAKRTRKNKDEAYKSTIVLADDKIADVSLTAKQVDFIKHLPDTCFWENGLDSQIWCDILADEIGGQFAGKPMTVGAMLSTICEKDLGIRCKDHMNGKKCTSFALTELGKLVAAELGVH